MSPRLARMVLEADKNGCAREVMVIAAALSIQDPREHPADKQTQADRRHRPLQGRDERLPRLPQPLALRPRTAKGTRIVRLPPHVQAGVPQLPRIREWQDVYSQLRTVAKQMGIRLNEATRRSRSCRAAWRLLGVGMKDVKEPGARAGGARQDEYLGARNAKFAIFPGSALFKKPRVS